MKLYLAELCVFTLLSPLTTAATLEAKAVYTPATSLLDTYSGVTKNIQLMSSKTSHYAKEFNDPLWPNQWYLQDYRTSDGPVMDLNVVPAYKRGYTGLGITVAIVDDGVVGSHPDLETNFLADLSYDYANRRPDPSPDRDPNTKRLYNHGTLCAGEIAMVANNTICGVGVAFNSKIVGVKIIGTKTFEHAEALGLVNWLNKTDIYSNSWGPDDDGQQMEKLDKFIAMALTKGVTKGRNEKGAIYMFAAGNGKRNKDNCATDAMVNNINTIAIAPASQKGKVTYYGERCTAIYAATYSSNFKIDEKVASSEINTEQCTTNFKGTSAAVPLASGIIALVLQANGALTYRDVMHIITMGAEVAPLADNEDIWYRNAKGFWVSNDFGFGLLNADKMVDLALNWKTVPRKNICIEDIEPDEPQYLAPGSVVDIFADTTGCQDSKLDAVYYLEQLELNCTINYPLRGAITIQLISPQGTKSEILEARPNDQAKSGLDGWSLKSVHNWGEDPNGTWIIRVKIIPIADPMPSGYIEKFSLKFHGTHKRPAHYDSMVPRKYAPFRLFNGKTSEDKLGL